MQPDNSVIVLLSGGPDSAALAWQALEDGLGVVAMTKVYPPGYEGTWKRHPADVVAALISERFGDRFVYHHCHVGMPGSVLRKIGAPAEGRNSYAWVYQFNRVMVDGIMLAYPQATRIAYMPRSESEKKWIPTDHSLTNAPMQYRWQDGLERYTPAWAQRPFTKRDVMEAMPWHVWSATLSCPNAKDMGTHWIPCEVCLKCKERAEDRREAT